MKRTRQKKNWARFCRNELRQAKRTVGSHLRWIIKGRARASRVREIPLRRTHLAGFDVFESKTLPYTDKDGKVVDCVAVKKPPDLGFFTPRPYMILSPRAYTQLIESVKGEK